MPDDVVKKVKDKKSIINRNFLPHFLIDSNTMLFYGTFQAEMNITIVPYVIKKYDAIKGGIVEYKKPDEITINHTKKAVEELGIESMWPGVQFEVFEPIE